MRRFIERNKLGLLLLIVMLGLFLRLRGLDQVGFNEDEVNKVEAARAYLHGHFSVNLDHPMLMKLMVAASVAAADAWNGSRGASHQISEEVAVRLPNVIFGSLTAVVIYLFAQEFFGSGVGLVSALLWAIGIIPITINRMAKEDTLLVFFAWLAYYFYLRAKKLGASRTPRQHRLYALSGASFGLMLASKYFPHYLGLNMLYYHLRSSDSQNQPRGRRGTLLLLGMFALVFLLANPLVALPSTLSYMWAYVREQTVTHHGYLMMGQFRYEDLAHFRNGMPFFFYLLFLSIKTPFPILAAFLAGLVQIFRRRREAGPSFILFMFLFWIIPFSLLSAKWLRWMLSWMPTVYIIAAIGLTKMASWLSSVAKPRVYPTAATAVVSAFVMVVVTPPLWVAIKAAPFYSLYLNSLAGSPPGYYFPHDELNDAGLRVAIQQICAEAPRGATVGGESEPVFDYYFRRFGRDDLRYVEITDATRNLNASDPYLVVQTEREHLENFSFVRELESKTRPGWTVEVRGAPAAQVYHLHDLTQLMASR